MKSLLELVAEAQKILDAICASQQRFAIACHDEFAELLETEKWDDPAITLSDARLALNPTFRTLFCNTRLSLNYI